MATSLAVQPITQVAATDLVRDLDLTDDEVQYLLDLAAKVKLAPAKFAKALTGKYVSLLFEKPSLRTRLTFELAIKQLGGDSVVAEGPVDGREPLKDVARNLERWVQGIVARTYSQATIEELARWSSAPVINALSDLYHPCQALADMLTIKERLGRFEDRKLAFVGDGNNVAHSLMLTGARLGMHVAVATPARYQPTAAIVAQARKFGRVTVTQDPVEAVAEADAVYTDVWTSMGQESQAGARARSLAPYQVNDGLLAKARSGAIFMHCLPAKRGQEVTDAVMESPRCTAFVQAENRLHVQKALLVILLG